MLGHLISLWARLSAVQTAVVYAETDTRIGTELDRLRFPAQDRIVNPQPERGMFSSIQCAANWPGWNPNLTHWAIVLGDQPHLQPTTLVAFMKFAECHSENICQPSLRGHARHPVILPHKKLVQLKTSNVATLKEFLQSSSNEVKLIELDDPGLELDLDDNADYKKALRLTFGK